MPESKNGTAPMVSIKVTKPCDLVKIDIVGPLKKTKFGRAISNYQADTLKFGVPRAIFSDQTQI